MMRGRRILVAVSIALASSGFADEGSGSIRVVATTPAIATAPPEYVAAPGQQHLLASTAIRGGFLVAWKEFAGWPAFSGFNLRVTRVTDDGTVVDRTGIRVMSGGPLSVAMLPEEDGARLYWVERSEDLFLEISSVAVSGDGWVGPVESLGTLPPESPDGIIHASRSGSRDFLRFGRWLLVVDRARIETMTDLGGWGEPSTLTASSRGVVATWVTSDGVLMAQWISLAGEIVGAAGGTGLASKVSGVGADSDGSDVLIVYSTPLETRLVRVDSESGTAADAGSLPVPWMQPLVVWNGSRYLVAWNQNGLVAVDVPATGAVSFSPRSLVPRAEAAALAAVGDTSLLVADRRGYCIRYVCETDVWVSTLPKDASRPAESSALVSAVAAPQESQRVAACDGGFFSIWREPGKLLGATVRPGQASESLEIPVGVVTESATLVSDGTRLFALAIGNDESAKRYLRGVFLDALGNVEGERASVPLTEQGAGLTAASSGTMFLAAWRRTDGVVATRFDSDGRVLDGAPVPLGPAEIGSPTVTASFDGSAFVVAWVDIEGEYPFHTFLIRVAQVSPSGVVASAGAPVRSSTPIADPAIACGGGRCLLAWTQRAPSTAASDDIAGVFLRAGDLTDASAVFSIADSDWNEAGPSVAWDGRSFFISWSAQNPEDSSSSVARATSLDFHDAAVTMREAVSLGPIALDVFTLTRIACRETLGCAEVHPSHVADELHGNTTRLFKTFLREARPRGIRR